MLRTKHWVQTKLCNVATFTNGGAWNANEYVESGIPVVRVTDCQNGTVNISACKYLSEAAYAKYRKHEIVEGDLIVATVGSHPTQPGSVVGRPIVVPREASGALLNQNAVCIRPTEGAILDKRFLSHFAKAPSFGEYVIACARGSANQVRMAIGLLKEMPIELPPLPTQRKIAAILSAYDDLIENNLRRIKILEEMAQNLYREWFVKFRFPGYQHARFTDSPLGRIPEGWLGLFPDFVEFKEGPGLRKWQYRSEGLPFLNIRTLADNDIDLSKVQYLDPKEVETKYQHFLLKEYDHVVSSSGTLGRIVTIQKQHLPLMLNTSIIRMRPSTLRVGRWQLKHFLNSDYFQHQILSFAIGAAQPNFGPSHLQQMLIPSPSDKIGILYEKTMEPFEEMIGTLVLKNTTLRRTPDLLLPRLISGEVDVSGLDITVPEEAGA